MSRPVVYGEPFHPNTRSVLFALAEKGAEFRIEPASGLKIADAAVRPSYGEPVLDVAGFRIHGIETILRFIAEGFAGPALQPGNPRERARMNRALEVNYHEAATTLGNRIAGRYLASAIAGELLDSETSQSTIADARRTIDKFESIFVDDDYLAGNHFSIADIAVGSLLAYVIQTPSAELIVPAGTRLRTLWERISSRPAFIATIRDSSLLDVLRQN